MSLSGSLQIGSLSIPLVLLLIILISVTSLVAGFIVLRKEKENRTVFSDLFFSPVIPFLLAWKFSLVLTEFQDVLQNPGLMLYSSGSLVNIIIGIIISGAWLTFRWKRSKPSKSVYRAMAAALGTTFLLIAAISGYGWLSTENNDLKTELPIVVFSRSDGSSWTISEASGSTVVLNFWASWCPPCRSEMPMLERMQKDASFKKVTFFAINASTTEKTPEDGQVWMTTHGFQMPLLFDITGEGMMRYKITGLPTTIIIDSQGREIYRKTGAVSRSWILRAVRKAKRTIRNH